MGVTWTEEQKQAIEAKRGHLLVSAAAGSGKTAVLVERIIEMILGVDAEGRKIGDGIDIDEVLVVTFTRAAAAQMKEKIANRLTAAAETQPENEHLSKQLSLLSRADIMTIDSFCMGIVKEYFQEVGLDASFEIAEGAEMELIKNDVFDEVLEEKYAEHTEEFITLVNCFSRKESDAQIRDLVYRVYRVASGYPKPERWMYEAMNALDVSTPEELRTLPWYQGFEHLLRTQIDAALSQIEVCLTVSSAPDGPAGYLDLLHLDESLLMSLKDADSLDQMLERMDRFPNLKRIAACDPEKQQFVKEQMQTYRSKIKDLFGILRPSDQIFAECNMMAAPLRALLALTLSYMERLRGEKQSRNLYEFRDISEFAYGILCGGVDAEGRAFPSDAGRAVGERYREILIDEYQDSNFLQEDILTCVSGHGANEKNMFMVGDVKQSIYQFRMARPDLFLHKYDTYQTDAASDERKIILSKNFRSARTVIDTVNAIFTPLMHRDLGGIDYDEQARLAPGRLGEEDAGGRTEILIAKNDLSDGSGQAPEDAPIWTDAETEAHLVADEIYEIVKGKRPVYLPADEAGKKRRAGYRDIVILMRSVKKYAKAFETAFAEKGIPLYVESESGYFDAMEISTLLSMLAAVDNAHLDYELAEALRSPLGNVTEKELARIVGVYDRDHAGDERHLNRTASLYQKAKYFAETYGKQPTGENMAQTSGLLHQKNVEECPSQELCDFLMLLAYLKEHKSYMSIRDMIGYILEQTGYYWFVGAMADGRRRQANIDMLMQKADAYEDSSFRGLFNFLRYMDRLKTNEIDFSEATVLSEQEDTVQMITMHKSKGLEFPIVFVSGLAGRFSNLDALLPVAVDADRYLAGYAIDLKHRAKKKTFARSAMLLCMKMDRFAEEIRVLYVALTRAREKLYLTAAIKDPGEGKNVFEFSNQAEMLAGAFDENRTPELPLTMRTDASCYMDWIVMALSTQIVSEEMICRKDTYASWIAGKQKIEQAVPDDLCDEAGERKEMKTAGDETCSAAAAVQNTDEMSDLKEEYRRCKERLSFVYPYQTSKQIKSKLSVTEIKRMANRGEEQSGTDWDWLSKEKKGASMGKDCDQAEQSDIPTLKSRQTEAVVHGNEMGTVIHKIMELIDFTKHGREEIDEQIDDMFEHGFLDKRFLSHVKRDKIYKMVNSPLGRRMAAAQEAGKLFRERQFYISMEPEALSQEYKESHDPVIVQGVIDAYFIENGQIILLDYKTDRVEKPEDLIERYRVQLDLYAETLTRLTGMPVAEKQIYAFHFDVGEVL